MRQSEDSDGFIMNSLEEGALGDPVLAGNLVYYLDGRQQPYSGQCSWGGASWRAKWYSSTGPGRVGRAHCADATQAGPSVSSCFGSSMETMSVETKHA